jgi:hypothetical protein
MPLQNLSALAAAAQASIRQLQGHVLLPALQPSDHPSLNVDLFLSLAQDVHGLYTTATELVSTCTALDSEFRHNSGLSWTDDSSPPEAEGSVSSSAAAASRLPVPARLPTPGAGASDSHVCSVCLNDELANVTVTVTTTTATTTTAAAADEPLYGTIT